MGNDNFIDSYSIYSNRFSYMGRPLSRNPDDADVFVVGLPYDLGTSGRAGTRGGPGGIRAASANLRWEEKRWPWDFNVFDRLRVAVFEGAVLNEDFARDVIHRSASRSTDRDIVDSVAIQIAHRQRVAILREQRPLLQALKPHVLCFVRQIENLIGYNRTVEQQ